MVSGSQDPGSQGQDLRISRSQDLEVRSGSQDLRITGSQDPRVSVRIPGSQDAKDAPTRIPSRLSNHDIRTPPLTDDRHLRHRPSLPSLPAA